MKLRDFDAFILDMDGTLIDSGKYHAQAFADAVLAESGYILKPEEHHEFFATHSNIFSEVLNKRYNMALDPERVLARKRKRMLEIFVAELFEGAREFLNFWMGSVRLGLATNSPMSFVQLALEEAGIFHCFEAVTTADEVRQRKPDPEIVEITIQKLGVEPLKTLVFEDQLIGIDAARRAGARVVAIDNNQPVQFPADVAVYTWSDLLKLSEAASGAVPTDL